MGLHTWLCWCLTSQLFCNPTFFQSFKLASSARTRRWLSAKLLRALHAGVVACLAVEYSAMIRRRLQSRCRGTTFPVPAAGQSPSSAKCCSRTMWNGRSCVRPSSRVAHTRARDLAPFVTIAYSFCRRDKRAQLEVVRPLCQQGVGRRPHSGGPGSHTGLLSCPSAPAAQFINSVECQEHRRRAALLALSLAACFSGKDGFKELARGAATGEVARSTGTTLTSGRSSRPPKAKSSLTAARVLEEGSQVFWQM